jgi:DNA-binding MarR family transcriptional regulator
MPRKHASSNTSQTLLDLTPFAPLYDLPGHLVRRVEQLIHILFKSEAGRFGITSAQYAILSVVRIAPGLEQREIAQAAGYDAATTGGILHRLEALRLVRRNKGTRSRRGHCIELTTAGRRKLRAIEPAIIRLQEKLLKSLAPSERGELLRLLSKLTRVTNSYNP